MHKDNWKCFPEYIIIIENEEWGDKYHDASREYGEKAFTVM